MLRWIEPATGSCWSSGELLYWAVVELKGAVNALFRVPSG